MARLTENIFEQHQPSFVEAVIVDCPTGDSPDTDHDTACVEVPSMYSIVHGAKILKDVPIFYHCEANPGSHGRSLKGGASAFRKGDHVILSTNPLAIVGFADGSLRACKKLFLWVGVQSGFYCERFHPLDPNDNTKRTVGYHEVSCKGSKQYVVWDVEEECLAKIKKPDGNDVTYPCTLEDLDNWRDNWIGVGESLFHIPIQDNAKVEFHIGSKSNSRDSCSLSSSKSVTIVDQLEDLRCPVLKSVTEWSSTYDSVCNIYELGEGIDARSSDWDFSGKSNTTFTTSYGENFSDTFEYSGNSEDLRNHEFPYNYALEANPSCESISNALIFFDYFYLSHWFIYHGYLTTEQSHEGNLFTNLGYNFRKSHDQNLEDINIFYNAQPNSRRFGKYAFDMLYFMKRSFTRKYSIGTSPSVEEGEIEYHANASLLIADEDIDPDKPFNLADLREAELPDSFNNALEEAMEISHKDLMKDDPPPEGIVFGVNPGVARIFKTNYGRGWDFYTFHEYFGFSRYCDFGFNNAF